MNKRIAIAIPTYNRKDHLYDCLVSIQAQTEKNFEVYIFDNDSNYNIENFLTNFDNIKINLVRSSKNIGNLANFGRIFNYNFNNDYLVVFHDDDTMHPNFLKNNMQQMDTHSDAVFIGSKINFINDSEKMFKFLEEVNTKNNTKLCNQYDLVKLIISGFNLCFGSIMYRTKYLDDSKFNTFTNKYHKWCDRPFLLSLANKGSVLISEVKLVNYRVHQNQDSQSHSIDKQEELLELFVCYKNIFLTEKRLTVNKKIFFEFSTNNLILSGFSFAKNFSEYIDFIRIAESKGIFKVQYINIKGIWYIFRELGKICTNFKY